MGLAGQAMSGIVSARNNAQQKQARNEYEAKRQAEIEAEMHSNPLARSENRHALNEMRKATEKATERATNVNKITGATPEATIAQQELAMEAMGDVVGKIASGESDRQDKLIQERRNLDDAMYQDRVQERAARNETFANLASNAGNIVGSSLQGLTDTKTENSQQNNWWESFQKAKADALSKL